VSWLRLAIGTLRIPWRNAHVFVVTGVLEYRGDGRYVMSTNKGDYNEQVDMYLGLCMQEIYTEWWCENVQLENQGDEGIILCVSYYLRHLRPGVGQCLWISNSERCRWKWPWTVLTHYSLMCFRKRIFLKTW